MAQPIGVVKMPRVLFAPHNRRFLALLLLVSLSLLFFLPSPVEAQGTITLVSAQATSKFPEGFLFQVKASSSHDITDIVARFRIGLSRSMSYDYLKFEKGTTVSGELLFRTDGGRYIPPGTQVTYHFEIEDSAGNKLATEPKTFVYLDTRFEWQEVSRGPITVAYHGPVKTRAELVLSAMTETLNRMGPLLGVQDPGPVRVSVYNNVAEMLKALPARSQTISRELITEGQAFTDIGHLLILGSGTQTKGTASHEFTHILVQEAAGNPFSSIPSWLNEGLAEYGNIDPGYDYDRALEFAKATNRLLPLIYVSAPPSTPEDIIIFYGQSKSVVKFLIDKFGDKKLREFLATFKSGKSIDDSLTAAYGFDRNGLDRQWRESIGAPPYVPPEQNLVRPTQPSLPTFLPYSLTPQPGQSLVPSPTAAALPEPTPKKAGGGGCSAPAPGSNVALDPTLLAVLVGLVGLGWMRRRKR